MPRSLSKAVLSTLAILAVLLGVNAALITPVQAAGPFTVNTMNDTHDAAINGACADSGGQCSLRAAIEEANASATPTTINLPAGTYNLTLGELSVSPNGGRSLTLNGAGAASTIIHQTDTVHRVFNIDFNAGGSTLTTLNGVTISGGSDQADSFGGAGILAGSVTSTPLDSLTLSNCIVTANHASQPNNAYTGQPGGGLQMAGGNLTVTNCTFSNNTSAASQGGAIAYIAPTLGGTVSITGSTFDGNSLTNNSTSGPDGGGAVYINSASAAPNTVTISNSTFQNNSATSTSSGATFGGAIYINTGVLNIDHSTFTANSASGTAGAQGGAIYVDSGMLNLTFSRLVGNSAAGGGSGVYNHASNAATTSATNDWWGCNAGPASAPCNTAATNAPAASLTTSPWITLTNTPSPATLFVTQASTLTASFLQNSASQALTSAQVSVLAGLPVTWGNAVLGALSAQQAAIQSNGQATTTFIAGTAGGTGHADASVDGQIVTANITIIVPLLYYIPFTGK